MANFRSVFLQNSDVIEQVFLFVYQSFHSKKLLSETRQEMTQSAYGSMVMTQSIFTFALIIDNTVKHKYSDSNPHKQDFINLLTFLSQKSGLSLDMSRLREINKKFRADFKQTLNDLLNSQQIFRTKFKPIEEDISIVYGFRNSAAHKIRDRPYIHDNLGKIMDRIFNVFFLAIEKLYL